MSAKRAPGVMRRRMSENTIAGAAEDRAPIERWEGEGGRTLALEESLSARSRDLPHSDPKDGISLDATPDQKHREGQEEVHRDQEQGDQAPEVVCPVRVPNDLIRLVGASSLQSGASR